MTVTFLIKTQNDLIVITLYQHLLYHTVLVTQFLRLFYFLPVSMYPAILIGLGLKLLYF